MIEGLGEQSGLRRGLRYLSVGGMNGREDGEGSEYVWPWMSLGRDVDVDYKKICPGPAASWLCGTIPQSSAFSRKIQGLQAGTPAVTKSGGR